MYLLHIRRFRVLEGNVESQGQKPIVEVLCEERDHRGLDGDVLGSILATNSENSVDFEDLRDENVRGTLRLLAGQQLVTTNTQRW